MENVTSIGAVNHSNWWNERMCGQVKRVFPRLRKVLTYDYPYTVWELKGVTWVTRAVGTFSSWEIIQGTCDDL